MLRRSLSAVAVMFVFAGLMLAGEHSGVILSIEKDTVKVRVGAGKKKKGEEKTFKLGKDVKFVKIGKDTEQDATQDDLTKAIEKSKNKGVRGKIFTTGEGDAETVTKIGFGGKRKKGS